MGRISKFRILPKCIKLHTVIYKRYILANDTKINPKTAKLLKFYLTYDKIRLIKKSHIMLQFFYKSSNKYFS